MIATHATRRSLMDQAFLYGIQWTDAHPKTMLACWAIALIVGCCLGGSMP